MNDAARLAPQNEEAETSVLGAVLLASTSAPDILAGLTAGQGLAVDDFYRERHRRIFRAMLALADRREAVDALTVSEQLARDGELEEAGGPAYVHSLPNLVPAAGNVRAYADIVLEHSRLRRKLEAARQIQDAAFAGDWDAIAKAEGLLGEGGRTIRTASIEGRQDALVEHIERGHQRTFPWPFRGLNELTGGIWPGHFTVIAAFTSWGKSVLLDQVLEYVRRHGDRVHGRPPRLGVYLTEMSTLERDMRFVSRAADLSLLRLMLGDLRDGEHAKFAKAVQQLPFDLVQAGGMTAKEIARDIYRRGWDIAGVDLLNGLPGSSKTEDIDENVRTLAGCANDTGTTILACQHLNRNRLASSAYPPPPVLADIRGSGQIADLANNVLFIYREEAETMSHGELVPTGKPGEAGYLDLAKARMGQPGRVPIEFQANRVRFVTPSSPGAVGSYAA